MKSFLEIYNLWTRLYTSLSEIHIPYYVLKAWEIFVPLQYWGLYYGLVDAKQPSYQWATSLAFLQKIIIITLRQDLTKSLNC